MEMSEGPCERRTQEDRLINLSVILIAAIQHSACISHQSMVLTQSLLYETAAVMNRLGIAILYKHVRNAIKQHCAHLNTFISVPTTLMSLIMTHVILYMIQI